MTISFEKSLRNFIASLILSDEEILNASCWLQKIISKPLLINSIILSLKKLTTFGSDKVIIFFILFSFAISKQYFATLLVLSEVTRYPSINKYSDFNITSFDMSSFDKSD